MAMGDESYEQLTNMFSIFALREGGIEAAIF